MLALLLNGSNLAPKLQRHPHADRHDCAHTSKLEPRSVHLAGAGGGRVCCLSYASKFPSGSLWSWPTPLANPYILTHVPPGPTHGCLSRSTMVSSGSTM